MSADISRNGQ